MAFHSFLFFLRNLHHLSQSDLAAILDVSSMTIYRYEKDICKPSLKFLLKLSLLFDIPFQTFSDLSNIPPFDFLSSAKNLSTDNHI